MAQIKLHGEYAIGEHAFAVVDDADHAWLSQWRWRAKPGRNTVYAVRSSRVGMPGRRQRLVNMHREILGLQPGDGIETDHIDHNGLNNRRVNLRTCTTAQNQKNRIRRIHVGVCARCGCGFERTQRASRPPTYCSRRCGALAADTLSTATGSARADRLLASLDSPGRTVEIAQRSGLHIVTVWRLLPQLVLAGRVRLVQKDPHIYTRSSAAL